MPRFLTILALCFCLSSAVAQAADKNATPRYAPTNIQNMSNALFKIGVLRPSDPLAVDEYIRIHHCGLYEQYGTDDIAWTRLREAQARELTLLHPSLNENLEVEGSITLGDYDFTGSSFALTAQTALHNMGLVSIMDYADGQYEPCVGDNYKTFVPRAHPLHLIAHLSVPLDLTDVPVPRAAADLMIKEMAGRTSNKARRSALLVMHIHLNGPDPLAGSSDSSRMTVTGDLDEYSVYDGPDRKVLLYTKRLIDPAAKKTDRP